MMNIVDSNVINCDNTSINLQVNYLEPDFKDFVLLKDNEELKNLLQLLQDSTEIESRTETSNEVRIQ
jgi:hypothetical protein